MKNILTILFSLIIYLVFWIILNERATLEVFIIGIGISALIYSLKLKVNKADTVFSIRKTGICIWFFIMLIKEIFISNINVAKILLNPKMNIKPCIVSYRSKLKRDLYRTVLANAITLTPGTVTLSMKEDVLTVHCLSEEYAEGLIDLKLEKLLLSLEDRYV